MKSNNVNRTIQHETSHTLAALDESCTSGQSCVMQYDGSFTGNNIWCDACTNTILNYVAELASRNAND